MKWIIADISQKLQDSNGKTISVKEQRVDGSCCIKSKLMQLRCTLMGFERYYQISIPSNQIIILSDRSKTKKS
jgi:hypothetical protein